MRSFLITIFIFCVGLSLQDVYSQNYDKATVFETQKRLQELAYNPGPLDGIWGKKTEGALKRFQHDNSLPVTGELDYITKQKLGFIPLEKSEPERMIPSTSFQDSIPEDLKSNLGIDQFQIENDKLMVSLYLDNVTKEAYASMILEICQYPKVYNQFKQIWILNGNRRQGWVLLNPQECDQIIRSPLNQGIDHLFRHSSDVLIFHKPDIGGGLTTQH
jgi:hypothetical protein